MKQVLLVAQREFLTQVKNKSFIIMTVLSPLLIILAIGAVVWFSMANEEHKNIAVVDESGLFFTELKSTPTTSYLFYTKNELNSIKDTLNGSKFLNALLHIPLVSKTDLSPLDKHTQLFTNGNLGMEERTKIKLTLDKKAEEMLLQNKGVDPEVIYLSLIHI